jgi:hypothetical protein
MVVVKEAETEDPGGIMDEASRAVPSGGIIGPAETIRAVAEMEVVHGNH